MGIGKKGIISSISIVLLALALLHYAEVITQNSDDTDSGVGDVLIIDRLSTKLAFAEESLARLITDEFISLDYSDSNVIMSFSLSDPLNHNNIEEFTTFFNKDRELQLDISQIDSEMEFEILTNDISLKTGEFAINNTNVSRIGLQLSEGIVALHTDGVPIGENTVEIEVIDNILFNDTVMLNFGEGIGKFNIETISGNTTMYFDDTLLSIDPSILSDITLEIPCPGFCQLKISNAVLKAEHKGSSIVKNMLLFSN